jgi:ornithine cyclodeaminase
VRWLTGETIQERVPAWDLVPVVAEALAMVAEGAALVPERTVLPLTEMGGTLFVMPAFLPALPSLTVKIVTVHDANAQRGLPTTQGQLMVLDPASGRWLGQLDGAVVTQLRTGAVVGLATRHLAPNGADILGVIGSGAQAAGIVEAILGLDGFSFREVRVFSRDPARRDAFVGRMASRMAAWKRPVPVWRSVASADEATAGAGVVVTATTARTPVVHREAVSGPCLINAVGVFRPEDAELDADIVGDAALVVVESRTAAAREAGDLIQAARRGRLVWDGVRELSEVVAGRAPRPGGDAITVFKSVGVAALDAAVGWYILKKLAP